MQSRCRMVIALCKLCMSDDCTQVLLDFVYNVPCYRPQAGDACDVQLC